MYTQEQETLSTGALDICGGCGNALWSDQRITTYVDGKAEAFCSRKCVIDARQTQTILVQ